MGLLRLLIQEPPHGGFFIAFHAMLLTSKGIQPLHLLLLGSMLTATTIQEQVQELVGFLNNQFYVDAIESGRSVFFKLAVIPGRKYFKVVSAVVDSKEASVIENHNPSCYCFIDQEGAIYKSASWKTPVKGARATIEAVLNGTTKADPYGSWLYLK